jgi:hypothetical protein
VAVTGANESKRPEPVCGAGSGISSIPAIHGKLFARWSGEVYGKRTRRCEPPLEIHDLYRAPLLPKGFAYKSAC